MTARPEKGTPEYELWRLAIEVAHAAPLKRGAYSQCAAISWPIVLELREALEAVGIDWRAHHPQTKAKARKAAQS